MHRACLKWPRLRFFKYLVIFLVFCFSHTISVGAPKKGFPKKPPSEMRSPWSSRWALEWINGLLLREVAESDVNPDNQVFSTPRGLARTDIRGDLKLNYKNDFRFVLRPRFLGTSSEVYYQTSDKKINKSEGKWDVNEAFLDYDASSFLAFTMGLQNFQWGPAESLSPSNILFHFENDQKSVFYRAKGKVLVRSNLTLFGNHSLILIHEPESNREPYWIANQNFEKKTLIKWESRRKNDSNTYFGLTYGIEERNRNFWGGYFNFFYKDAYSFYADFKQSDGSIAYYPKEIIPGQFSLQENPLKRKEAQHLAVIGFRVESRGDLRVEYLMNTAGYDQNEIENLGKSLGPTQVFYLNNLSLALRPGLELYTQNYLYLSYRLPDLGSQKQATLFLRYLKSFLDNSGTFELNWESPLNNFFNYYVELSATDGKRNSEFRLSENATFFIGAKFSL